MRKKYLWILALRVFKRRPLMPRGPWLRSLNNVWKPQGCTDPRSVSVDARGREGRVKHCQESLEGEIFLNRSIALKAVRSKPSLSSRQVIMDPNEVLIG